MDGKTWSRGGRTSWVMGLGNIWYCLAIYIGRLSPAFPVTPPYVRVSYTAVRRVEPYRTVNLGSPSEAK